MPGTGTLPKAEPNPVRVACITGASRGLGAALAQTLLRSGWQVAACGRSARPDWDPEAEQRERFIYHRLDVGNSDSLREFHDRNEQQLGSIDLWINNAGVLRPIGPFRKQSSDDIQQHLQVNLLGVINGCRVFLHGLHRRKGGGTLVNISSGAARHAYAGWSSYCVSKAAVDMLSQVLAEEESTYGIRVLAIAPGVVDTSMQALIACQSAEDFPLVERFRRDRQQGLFLSPEASAAKVIQLALDPPQRRVLLDVRDAS